MVTGTAGKHEFLNRRFLEHEGNGYFRHFLREHQDNCGGSFGGIEGVRDRVDAFYVKDVKRLTAKDYGFLVISSPTRYGTMTLTVRMFLGKVKSKEWANKPFAAFDTENTENIEKKGSSAAAKIAEKLKEKQMSQLPPVLQPLVLGWKGPLQEGETERAKE